MQGTAATRLRAALRVALSHYVASGLSVAFGLLLISAGVHLWLGAAAAGAAAVGVIVAIPPDMPAPRRGKFWHMLPAPLLGLPLFFAVQRLHDAPWGLGLLLVPATFLAFLAMGWGRCCTCPTRCWPTWRSTRATACSSSPTCCSRSRRSCGCRRASSPRCGPANPPARSPARC